jgi:hypothetical protein
MPPEKIALKEYIDDGLKRGTLHHSEALDACSFFFIDKKDGKLRPIQDYRPLNIVKVGDLKVRLARGFRWQVLRMYKGLSLSTYNDFVG